MTREAGSTFVFNNVFQATDGAGTCGACGMAGGGGGGCAEGAAEFRSDAGPVRVLLITPPGSYRVHAYLEAARDIGLEMLVASEGEHSLVPGLTAGSGSIWRTPERSSSRFSLRIATDPSRR